jgi:hypothetical protein
LIDPTVEFFGFGPGLFASSHLTLSGLQPGFFWNRIAAAAAT